MGSLPPKSAKGWFQSILPFGGMQIILMQQTYFLFPISHFLFPIFAYQKRPPPQQGREAKESRCHSRSWPMGHALNEQEHARVLFSAM
ncbi:hypothetical protein CJ255_09550 [Candidatus Viridilinea mediisalina]|uniref:Uncharacterized protein n=1 Tax=Candidatus Viridilinea mediisalina TaxID=2024553 RepID=A0A2A6RK30_9CHLR|nr:hypothetical protein CJ255_09550 [Candidatus Viridilinea mediisalina]